MFCRCLLRRLQSSVAYTISEKAIRFRHPNYDPDRAQKLISSSMSRHLSTRNILSKSMHAFLSNLANRQTDKQTRAKTKNQRMSEEWQWRRRILVKGRGRFYMNIFECLFPPLFCIFSTGIRYHRRLFIIKSSEILGL